MENLKTRTFIAIFFLVLGVFWIIPNFKDIGWWPSKNKLTYGLDIQGGLHLVLGVDIEGVTAESAARLSKQLQAEMAKENIVINSVDVVNGAQGEMKFTISSLDTSNKIKEFINSKYGTVLQVLSNDAQTVVARYFETYLLDHQKKVVGQAIETIRNRIDEFGVAEPIITAQGNDRILIQLPGIQDAQKAKDLIKTSARLDFMMVSGEKTREELTKMIEDAEKSGNYTIAGMKYSEYVSRINKDLADKIPPKTVIYFEKSENAQTLEAGKIPFLLKTDTDLGGGALDDAFVSFNQYGSPEVSLVFNPMGAQKFSDLTGANVGKYMAVVLDKVVKSAPVINAKIGGGRAVITLGRARDQEKMMDEAKMIAMALRAGALPASLEQLEERTVGPTLGADSIAAAKKASIIGTLAIMVFVLLFYRGMGVIVNISLLVNVGMLLALLTSLGATLTLPGIAGIALTLGIAVDSNVIINERIKEELRRGLTFKAAIKEGYHRAMSAILDSNATTASTAFILMYFGTGPVRGFAVTLLLGILTTLFAGIFLTHVMVDWMIYKFKREKISI